MTAMIDGTHAAGLQSWVESANDPATDFPIQNLPFGVFHARKLRLHELVIRHAGWDTIHKKLGITQRFYDRFTPAISERDFALKAGPTNRSLNKALDFVAVCSNRR